MRTAALLLLALLYPPLLGAKTHAPEPPPVPSPHELVKGAERFSPSFKRLSAYPESLSYDVFWEAVPIGTATLNVREIVDFAGRPAYHITSHARSNKFLDAFYKVRDLNESWIDARTLSSLAYSKNIHEGRFRRNEWALYDPVRREFKAEMTGKKGKFKVFSGTVPARVQDILSSLYYVRSRPLTPGENIVLDVNTKKNWPLLVNVLKRETVNIHGDPVQTVRVEPVLRVPGIFVQKGRKLEVWLTDDDKKTPVMMRAELFFGHVTAVLIKKS